MQINMQVNCSKCSQPIALADIIKSAGGRLSHIDCKRPHVLTPEERALVFLYCSEHVVARCAVCDISYHYNQLATDILDGRRTNMCPRCCQDLTEVVRAHLFLCAMLPSEAQLGPQEVRGAAQRLAKESQQIQDVSDVLIRQAEATLVERQRALRDAMSSRARGGP